MFVSAALGGMCTDGNIKNKQVSNWYLCSFVTASSICSMLVCWDAPMWQQFKWVGGRQGTTFGRLPRMLSFSQKISASSCFKMRTTNWKVQNVEVRTRLLSLMLFTGCVTLATRFLFAICEMGEAPAASLPTSLWSLYGVTWCNYADTSLLFKARETR